MTHAYDVVLDGQLGQRFGQLRWKENGKSVEGMFFLLGVQNPIRGRREGNTLVLTHKLKTAVSTLSCQTRAELSGISLVGIVVTKSGSFVLAAAAYFIFCGGDSLKAYHALETLNNIEKLSMDVTVDATLDSDTTHTEATLQRKTVDGHLISYVQIEGVPLYYTDGAVILENGKAYQIHESFPDYAALLQKIVPLYLDLKAEHEDDTWTITIDGETAQELLQTAVPGLSEDSLNTQSVTVQVQLDADKVEKIELSANGTLQNALLFSVTICMEHFSTSASFEVPDAVLATVNSLDGDLPVITEDVLSLLAAWQRWKNRSSQTAAMSLSANLGPLVVNQSFNFYAGQFDGKQIYAISKDGVSIYWSGDQVVRQDGTPASAEEKELAKASELLDVLYVTCQNAAFTKTHQAETDVYTIQLDADGMEDLAALIAPDSRKLDLTFRSGELAIYVTQGEIHRISFDCAEKVKVVSLEENASLRGEIEFVDGSVVIPESAGHAL